MLMEKTHYLPHEELKESNYPEVMELTVELDTIELFAMKVDEAVRAYNQGRTDKVDVNINKVKTHIDLCRYVCEKLGKADNVCFEVLLEVRKIQKTFHDLLFSSNRFGSEYVGNPTRTSETGGEI